MPRIQTPNRFSFRKNSKLTKSTRHVLPLLIAGVALMAAVVFSVSVESKRGGWFWKAQPSASPKDSGAAKVASKPSTHSNANPTLGPGPRLASPVASPVVTATKADSLFTDVDTDTKADP